MRRAGSRCSSHSPTSLAIDRVVAVCARNVAALAPGVVSERSAFGPDCVQRLRREIGARNIRSTRDEIGTERRPSADYSTGSFR